MAISVRCLPTAESTLPEIEVATTARSSESSRGVLEIRPISSRDSARAIWYPFMMIDGCTPERTSSSAFCNSSEVSMTVVVVPSRAALSWADEVEMSSLAVGCSTFAASRTVTPSLVTVAGPPSSTSILSRPRGPRVERTAPASAVAALTLFTNAERPCRRSVSSRATSCSVSTICAAVRQPCFEPARGRGLRAQRACATVRFIYGSTIALYNLRLSSGI